MQFNLADLFEHAVDTWGEREYLVADELAYLFGNADLKALVHDAAFSDRVAGVADRMPDLRHRVVIGGDDASAVTSPDAIDFGPRSGDDRYILYTGGTTGMPKGVVWRHEDVLFALGGGIDILSGQRASRPEDLAERGRKMGFALTFLPIAPLMHGATQWAVMGQSFVGNKVVLMGQFDPHEVWRLVEAEKVNSMMMTGDAMARPLVEALDEQPSKTRDLSSLISLSSTAAVFSPSLKDQFLERFPNIVLTDAIGSSEGGANGIIIVEKGKTEMKGGPTVAPVAGTLVLDDELRPLEPGSGVVGRGARP